MSVRGKQQERAVAGDEQVFAASEAELVAFGARLAKAMLPGTAVYLNGELGAGKTTLTRGIARGLGHQGAVKSPTYTLVEPYLELATPLYHFDLYRLGDPEELEFMGMRDYFGGEALLVVEWPERGAGFLPGPDLEITLQTEREGRLLTLRAGSATGEKCMAALAAADG